MVWTAGAGEIQRCYTKLFLATGYDSRSKIHGKIIHL